MKTEALISLADFLENEINDYQFDMTQLKDDCGTIACIAGWACLREYAEEERTYVPVSQIVKDARFYLGLDENQSKHLFLSDIVVGEIPNVTRAEAISVLRHAAETGIISWFRVGHAARYDDSKYYSDECE